MDEQESRVGEALRQAQAQSSIADHERQKAQAEHSRVASMQLQLQEMESKLETASASSSSLLSISEASPAGPVLSLADEAGGSAKTPPRSISRDQVILTRTISCARMSLPSNHRKVAI
jgi:hypothetical protein